MGASEPDLRQSKIIVGAAEVDDFILPSFPGLYFADCMVLSGGPL
jgi:hypothetical protein